MQYITDEIREKYLEFKSRYRELVTMGEEFIQEGIFKDWKLEKYIQLKDELVYFLYRYFPQIYSKHFTNEPQLPKISIWYYILSRVLWIPEKYLNGIWWPKYGHKIENYMRFYSEKLAEAISEIESLD
ncbi:hypothetical protein BBF96_04200 [Anoxybacter fermentans]|uniref:Uncharacterized protein n=1 Tax=Anoxybacter fermentans TaxID=1323375 RepID=A0A3Q9HR14_9FIRM|nr:hypothetical protein [Anoxybacter fermentans]AZR72659.1 hypothetical protein BBF96_04200 [Anoxybacter fermentans]